MLKYSIKRIILAFITAFIILTLTFLLVKSLPPQRIVSSNINTCWAFYLNQCNLGYMVEMHEEHTELGECIAKFINFNGKDYYFYQRPVLDQYSSWLKNIITKYSIYNLLIINNY